MSNHEEHDRKQQPPYIDPSLLINTRLSEVERQQREDRAEEKKHKSDQLKINRSVAVFTGLLFLTSVVSDCVLFYQISINKESADAAKSAATTAEDTLKTTKALTEGANEAIGYGDVDCRDSEKGICQFSFANVGHVAAKNAHAHIEFSLRLFAPSNTQFGKTYERDIDQEEIVPRVSVGNSMYAPGHGDIYRAIDVPMLKAHKSEIESGQKALMVNVTLSYDNGFGSQRSAPHCEEIVYIRTGPPPSPNRVRSIVPCEGPYGIAFVVEEQRKLDRVAKHQE